METNQLREGLRMGIQTKKDEDKAEYDSTREGMRMGLDKDREDANQTKEGLRLGMENSRMQKESGTPEKGKKPPAKEEETPEED